MNRQSFERAHEASWSRLAQLLEQLETPAWKRRRTEGERLDETELPSLYRELCHHLALVRQRSLGLDLEERLNRLALRGRQVLYRAPSRSLHQMATFVLVEFPVLLRQEARLVLSALALFYVPLFGFMLLAWIDPATVELFVAPEALEQMAEMYGPAGDEGRESRGFASQVQMFGFYVMNNVGIALRTFSGGILAGIPTVFFLVFNGIMIGAACGHVSSQGFGDEFWSFVITHGSFELTAIALAGAAGLKLGVALVKPGRQTRRQALKSAAQKAVRISFGAAAMLFVAAFLEAFFSGNSQIPHSVKYGVGTLCWLLVPAWLLLAGRPRA